MKEVDKFNLVAFLKEDPDTVRKTAFQIVEEIEQKTGERIHSSTFRCWAKKFGIPFKRRRSPQRGVDFKYIEKTTQRVRMLALIVRNACKELDMKHPSTLDKLIDSIDEDLREWETTLEGV